MINIEICRACAEAFGYTTKSPVTGRDFNEAEKLPLYVETPSACNWNPLTNAEQAAQVRWKLLELGYTIYMYRNELHIFGTKVERFKTPISYPTDEYRILAETLARHQRETKNG